MQPERIHRVIIACAMTGCGLGVIAGMYAASAITHTDDATPAGLAITVVLAAIGTMIGYLAAQRFLARKAT